MRLTVNAEAGTDVGERLHVGRDVFGAREWGCRAGRWWLGRASDPSPLRPRSEMTCSHLPASVWASAHDRPRISVRKRSANRWQRTTRSARTLPLAVSRMVPLPVDDEALGLHPLDHLRHGRARHPQTVSDARLDHVEVVFPELEDALAVLLERRVELGHLRRLPVTGGQPARFRSNRSAGRHPVEASLGQAGVR